MINYDYNLIEENFKKLPLELQEVITSPEVNDTIQIIAKKYALQIDQLNALVDLVGLVILGLVSSKNFVDEFSRETGINEELSQSIAEDINREVFGKIRTSMRESSEKTQSEPPQPPLEPINPIVLPPTPEETKPIHISEIEKAGGFTIEDETSPAKSEEYKEPEPLAEHLVAELNGAPPANLPIEESIPVQKTPAPIPKPPVQTPIIPKPVTPPAPVAVETPVIKESTVNILPPTVPPAPKPISKPSPTVPPRPAGTDLYREPI